MNKESTCTELPEKLYTRILSDFFNINEIYPFTAVWFVAVYNMYLVSEVPLKINGEQVGVLRDVLCSNKPIDQVFINRLDGRPDIVWSMNNEGFLSFHLSDQDDDIKEKLGAVFDRPASYEDKNGHIDIDKTFLCTGADEFIEPPKSQNSIKRWKREKKYF